MSAPDSRAPTLGLRCGELVEVRGVLEILPTLDEQGTLEGLPFMPEMLRYCGMRFRVYKRADKSCDTVYRSGGRRMRATVHLENLRCDGADHGGCQAACLLFWKEAWLRRVEGRSSGLAHGIARLLLSGDSSARPATGCTEAELRAQATRIDPESGDTRYRCQATDLPRATEPLAWWDARQYVRDVASGNVPPLQLVRTFCFWAFSQVVRLGVGYRFLVGAYDAIQRMHGGRPYPIRQGGLGRTPSETLDLQPGELVEVKSLDEIVRTLDRRNRNRGLSFDAEMSRYCGSRYRVLQRVRRIIDERTGRLIELPNDCVILDGVVCTGEVSALRRFCPRAIYPYWREIWLRRVHAPASVTTPARPGPAGTEPWSERRR